MQVYTVFIVPVRTTLFILLEHQYACIINGCVLFQIFDGGEPKQDPDDACVYYLCNGGILEVKDVSAQCQTCADVRMIYSSLSLLWYCWDKKKVSWYPDYPVQISNAL